MAVNDYIYRLKAMPGDTAPHDELAVSGDLGTGITAALVDRGSGDVAWRFSAGRTAIAIPGTAVNMTTAGTGMTMAFTVKMVNSGTTAYRTILNVGPDQLPADHASASTSPGFSFARHGSTSVRATAVDATYTNNITSGADDRTYVIRFMVNKSGTSEGLSIWAYDPANPTVPVLVNSQLVTVGTSNSGTWDTFSIDCGTGVIVEIKDIVVWPNEKTDAECEALAVNLRGQLDSVADTEAPVFTGTMTSNTITSSGFTVDWSGCVRTDNVGITSYETSLNNTDWTDRGNVTSYAFTGLAASTAYTPYVRAKDAAGLTSTPPLTINVTTSATVVDTTPPTHTGALTEIAVSHNSFTVECPVATDTNGVGGYQASLDGVTWTDLGPLRQYTYEAATPSTAYTVQMRAYDNYNNFSTPALSINVNTLAAPDAYFTTAPLCDEFVKPIQNATNITVFISDVATGALLYTKTNQSTNTSGVMTISEPLATKGNYYRLIYQRPDGTANPPEGMQTLQAV